MSTYKQAAQSKDFFLSSRYYFLFFKIYTFMYSIIIGGILLFQQRLSSKTFFFLAVMQELSCIDSFQEYTSLDMFFKTGRCMFSVFFSALIQLSVSFSAFSSYFINAHATRSSHWRDWETSSFHRCNSTLSNATIISALQWGSLNSNAATNGTHRVAHLGFAQAKESVVGIPLYLCMCVHVVCTVVVSPISHCLTPV